MSVIIVLIIASIVIAAGFLIAFVWSVKDGQYDDNYSAANRILFDTRVKSTTENNEDITKNKN